jgi:hypothetical protein
LLIVVVVVVDRSLLFVVRLFNFCVDPTHTPSFLSIPHYDVVLVLIYRFLPLFISQRYGSLFVVVDHVPRSLGTHILRSAFPALPHLILFIHHIPHDSFYGDPDPR